MSFRVDLTNNGVDRLAGEKGARFFMIGVLEKLQNGVWIPEDISGQELSMVIRDSIFGAILFTLDTANGYAIVTDGPNGAFKLDVPSDAWDLAAGDYKHQMDMSTTVEDSVRVMEGLFQQTENLSA